ncbi:MAG: type II secretion system protein [Burkholderiales bacterium]
MKSKQTGFTLVEIAIVMVIIGLLLGGVLKGQQMIENAKIKNLVNDFNGVSAAINSYLDRYHRLPGDDGPTATLTGRGWTDAVGGNINGQLLTAANVFTTGASENFYLWQDLRYSGFITGNPTTAGGGRNNPLNAYNGMIGVGQSDATNGLGLAAGPIICMGSVPGTAAIAIDTALDDGVPNTGSVRGILGVGNTQPAGVVGATAYVEASTYTICKTL